MSRYLKEAPFDEAMRVLHSDPRPEPTTHTVWTGDFMGLCTHDIACPVCMDQHAIIVRCVDPARPSQRIDPCDTCRDEGWRIVKLPLWLLRWFP